MNTHTVSICIRIPPDSRTLALGCWDGTATVYRVSRRRSGWRVLRERLGITPSSYLLERGQRLQPQAASNTKAWMERATHRCVYV